MKHCTATTWMDLQKKEVDIEEKRIRNLVTKRAQR